MLYVVPTPVGNLEDMTYRAVRVLQEVDLILAEDTRTSGTLLKHYEITTPKRAFHQHNEHHMTSQVIDWLKQGQHIALISDAGTPGISDPGFLLVRACHEADVEITVLPGATAIIPAIVASGLPCDKFYFEGFLPHKKGRKTRLEILSQMPMTFAMYESPHRLLKCLQQLSEHCGAERQAAVVREISKLHEEIKSAPLAELIEHFAQKKVKGEIVVVVAGLGK